MCLHILQGTDEVGLESRYVVGALVQRDPGAPAPWASHSVSVSSSHRTAIDGAWIATTLVTRPPTLVTALWPVTLVALFVGCFLFPSWSLKHEN